jgi:hypothetical protein
VVVLRRRRSIFPRWHCSLQYDPARVKRVRRLCGGVLRSPSSCARRTEAGGARAAMSCSAVTVWWKRHVYTKGTWLPALSSHTKIKSSRNGHCGPGFPMLLREGTMLGKVLSGRCQSTSANADAVKRKAPSCCSQANAVCFG